MKVISVASAKGGVGKSTFCASVGRMLAHNDKRILLVDMDIGVRSLDILLGVSEKTVYNWGDVVKNNVDYRKAVIENQSGDGSMIGTRQGTVLCLTLKSLKTFWNQGLRLKNLIGYGACFVSKTTGHRTVPCPIKIIKL